MNELLIPMLASWKVLNQGLRNLREDQVKDLLDYEMMTTKRKDILVRLHQRYWKLRGQRELSELTKVI